LIARYFRIARKYRATTYADRRTANILNNHRADPIIRYNSIAFLVQAGM
jgi:hypothetical protein